MVFNMQHEKESWKLQTKYNQEPKMEDVNIWDNNITGK